MINKECIYRADAILACYDGFASCVDDCATNIRNLPAADVVEVIRCKDCKFTKTDGCEDPSIYCEKLDMWEMPPDGFCYRGRRR